jgi:hypothetical protein
MLLSNILSAEIKEINQMRDLERVLSPITPSDWVLFDIDYTLTEPTHPALQMSVIKQNKQRFKDELAKFSEKEKPLIPVLMVTQVPNQLTDKTVPAMIQKLQAKDVPILGFTAIDTAIIPGIGPIPRWRANELKKFGINFYPAETSPFPKHQIAFTEFPSFRETYPLYSDGILYANVTPAKGAVLIAFLKKASKKPSQIIFVDDSLENLQSVETELAKQGIPFLGIHYKVQVDETKLPKVADEEWNTVWDKLRERAKFIM